MSAPPTDLVLGTWGLAGAHGPAGRPMGYGDVSEGAAYELLDAAWDAGVRWVDTAPSYGGGEGVRRVGQWQRASGSAFHVVVKPGRPLVGGAPVSDLSLEGLRREIEHDRARLGQPAGLLLKDPPAERLKGGEAFALLDELERAYPGATCGFASHDLAASALAPPARRERVAQLEINGINWRVATPVARRLAASGWTVWAMQPLGYGFLAGRRAGSFDPDDFRSRIPAATQVGLAAAARSFLGALRRAFGGARADRFDDARLAVAFCVALPDVTRVVVGPKSPSQLRALLEAEQLGRDAAFRAAVAALVGASQTTEESKRALHG